MNAAVTIMQITDWSKYCLEDWLYQFGAWMHSNGGTCGKSVNPIAIAMDEAVKKQKTKDVGGKEQIIADWINDESLLLKVKKNKQCCEISDNEARAVQRLILDMRGQSEILDGWIAAIIDRYFYGNSWPEMVVWQTKYINGVLQKVKIYSENDARADVKCGLAVLHCRYGFIKYK